MSCPFVLMAFGSHQREFRRLVALLFLVAVPGSAAVGGEVYTMTNDPAGNAILGFHRDAQGKLAPLPGSPYMTGGLGVTPTTALGPFDSDQEIILSADKSRLFAVNGGSDSVSVFNIAADGSLSPVPGSPFHSGGSDPASLGLSGNTLVVVNQDEDPMHPGVFLPNYVTFRVNPAGALSRMPISTIFTELGASPSQALIGPKDDLVFSTDFLGGLLRSFKLSDSGNLTPVALLPLPPGEFADTGSPPLPLGLAPHPDRSLLYVGFVTISRMGVYKYNEKGALRFLRSVPSSGKGICWIRVNADGTRVYTSNTGDASISVYDSSDEPTDPIEIQKVTLRPVGQSNGFQIEIDPTGKFVFSISQQTSAAQPVSANALHVLSVASDGTLTEVPTSPTVLSVPNLVRPQGIAVR